MTVENAHAFLDELKEKGHSPELMSKIGTDFKDEHICQALKERGTSKDELLKSAAGGAGEIIGGWQTGTNLPGGSASAAAAA